MVLSQAQLGSVLWHTFACNNIIWISVFYDTFLCALISWAIQISCSNAGISRSATVALAYVMETENISLEAAYDRLKQSRPAIQPNPGFMNQLAEFQAQLRIAKH